MNISGAAHAIRGPEPTGHWTARAAVLAIRELLAERGLAITAAQERPALPPERHSPGQTGHGEGQDTSDDPIAVLRRLQAAGLGHLAEQLGVRLTNPTGPPQPWDITSYEHDPHGGPDIAIFADGHRMPIKPRPTGIEALKACGVTVAEAIQNLGYAPDAAERPAAEEAGS